MSNVVKLTNSKVCASCKTDNPEVQRCSRCQHVFYCNVTCQKMDWPHHKLTCRSVKCDPKASFPSVEMRQDTLNVNAKASLEIAKEKLNLINILPPWICAEKIVVLLSIKEQINFRQTCKAFRQIVDDFFAIDHLLGEAKATARSIEDPDWKDEALREIVKIEAQKDLEKAKVTARSIEHPGWKAQAFIGIVKIEAHKNLEGAKAMARSIENPGLKDIILAEIVKIEAQRDLEGAKATARSIEHPGWKAEALFVIVKIEVQKDLEGAKATVRSIEDSEYSNIEV